ncbi:hypothetical protein AB835_01420 [Candidatus Endobugula sertula]|uniref:Insecticidal toxin complex protein TccC n=1 Tax=Candidatus Endobugula sertula TaxID=62101 RepID=A0A1D2QTN7_9GAMM|nr:hypothetical protein AB835_01420 [Candidatus Endobugula sertula]
MTSSYPDIFKGTPTIAVNDNRGLPVRSVQFNRSVAGSARDTLISHSTYNAIGQLETSADPRQFDKKQVNQTQINNQAGQVLRLDSVDAGWRVLLPDVTGAPYKEWDGRGTMRRYEYDDTLHRPVATYEQNSDVDEGSERVTERFVYGDAAETANNLNLQLVCHYDQGGLLETTSVSLTGQPLIQQRRLLSDKCADSDWQGNDDDAWTGFLEDNIYSTQWTYNALGTVLSQQDAKGNVQRSEYDVAGLLVATYYQASGSTERMVLSEIQYNANGQVILETADNGIETTYIYDKQDWRLMQVLTKRMAKEGRSTCLQNLNYAYDPVGNIVSVNDSAQATRFYKNQRVVPEQTYTYDALYQLMTATGRENDATLSQSSSLPPLLPLGDASQYVNYTRQYHYDRAGNLGSIHHVGASTYTLGMVVSDKSNRVVQQVSDHPISEGQVDSYFDAHGNLKQLEHSKVLVWGLHDQLKRVDLTDHQYEVYQYSVQGHRIRKVLLDDSNSNESEVIYLPGLELRTKRNHGSVDEELHVVTLMNTGRHQVRALHWAAGLPTGTFNNQLRYSVDNHLGSSNLELDDNADVLTQEEYYPFGGTALWSAKSDIEAKYKYVRYSGKERDVTGLYYYGYRYYMPWMGRWLNPDPAGTVDGLNLYRMVRNNPVRFWDDDGRDPTDHIDDLDISLRLLFGSTHTLNPQLGPFQKVKDIGRLSRLRSAVGDKINLAEHEERLYLHTKGDSEGGHALNRHVPPSGVSALDWASRRYDVLKDHNIGSAAFYSKEDAEKLITHVIKNVSPLKAGAADRKREEILQNPPTKTLRYNVGAIPGQGRPVYEDYVIQTGKSSVAVSQLRSTLYEKDKYMVKDGLNGQVYGFTHDFGHPVGEGFQSRQDRDLWLASKDEAQARQYVRTATAIEVVITTGVGKKGTSTADKFKLVSAYPITR